MEPIFEGLREKGVIGDERRPGVIRLAPVPIYTRWADCRLVAEALETVLKTLPVRLRRIEDEKSTELSQLVDADAVAAPMEGRRSTTV